MNLIYNNFEPALTGRLFVHKRGISGAVGNIVGSGINAAGNITSSSINAKTQADINNAQLADAQRNRDFQASEAEKQRNYNSAEAYTSRVWQEAMQDKQNQWNLDLWNKNNEYNSLSSQIGRAKQAGVNPNALFGNMQMASVATGASMPSSPTASQASLPSGSMATLSNSNPWNFDNIADAVLKFAQAKKTEEDTKSVMSFNKFSDIVYEMGIEKDKAQIRKDYASADESMQSIKQMQAEVLKLNAETSKIATEERIKRIEEAYKSDEMQTIIAKAQKDMQVSDAEIYYMLTKLPSEIANNKASAFYMQKSGELSEHQKKVIDSTATLLATQNEREAWNLLLDQHYGVREREAGVKNSEYHNSTTYRFIDGSSKFVGAVTALVGGYLMGRKTPAGKAVDIKNNSIQTYSTPKDRFELFGK